MIYKKSKIKICKKSSICSIQNNYTTIKELKGPYANLLIVYLAYRNKYNVFKIIIIIQLSLIRYFLMGHLVFEEILL